MTCAKAPSNAALKVFHFQLAPPLPSLRTSFRTSSPIDRPPNCTLTHTSTAETDTREGNTLLGTCCRIEGEGNRRLRLFTKTTTTVITPSCGVALRVKAMRPMVSSRGRGGRGRGRRHADYIAFYGPFQNAFSARAQIRATRRSSAAQTTHSAPPRPHTLICHPPRGRKTSRGSTNFQFCSLLSSSSSLDRENEE